MQDSSQAPPRQVAYPSIGTTELAPNFALDSALTDNGFHSQSGGIQSDTKMQGVLMDSGDTILP